MKKMTLNKIGGCAGVVLLLGILVTLNAVLRPVRLRADVTEDKLYTLSEGTKQLLGQLDRDVGRAADVGGGESEVRDKENTSEFRGERRHMVDGSMKDQMSNS